MSGLASDARLILSVAVYVISNFFKREPALAMDLYLNHGLDLYEIDGIAVSLLCQLFAFVFV